MFPAGNAAPAGAKLSERKVSKAALPPKDAAKRHKDLSLFVRICCFCALIRGLQNLEAPLKGFNCCGAKLPLRRADLRFAKPRNFPERERFYVLFALCKKNQKAHQRFANLWTPGTIQIAGRYGVFAKMTGNHQVTGFAKSCNFAGYRRQ